MFRLTAYSHSCTRYNHTASPVVVRREYQAWPGNGLWVLSRSDGLGRSSVAPASAAIVVDGQIAHDAQGMAEPCIEGGSVAGPHSPLNHFKPGTEADLMHRSEPGTALLARY